MTAEPPKKEKFYINKGAAETGFRLPELPDNISAMDAETWATVFEQQLQRGNDQTAKSGFRQAIEQLAGSEFTLMNEALAKALNMPPTAFAYSRINYMPDPNASGILPWPGIAPEALAKIVRENVAPQMIIGMRCDDILRYSNLSSHPWKPGWKIEKFDANEEISEAESKDILNAQRFLLTSNTETKYTQARVRDSRRLTSFQNFLSAGTRDWLTFDELAIWTDMDNQGKVKQFSLLPAGNIRLATFRGYQNKPEQFAVGVDEGGKVIEVFTRDELVFVCRNPRTNVETSGDLFAAGYGLSEIEMSIRLIQGFQNVIDMNVDSFGRNSIPQGILTIIGATQRQLDFINRLWTNIKRGITKKHAMPVIGLPSKESKIELIDLSTMDGKDAIYKDWLNMMIGALATLYRFPVRRLGYRISGHGKDTEPMPDSAIEMVDEDDPGLAPLLSHFERVINEYLVWSQWPHLKFHFTGSSPKEDARQFDWKRSAMTWGEARTISGLKPLEQIYPTEHKLLAEIMDGAPIDANIGGLYQTIAASYIGTKMGDDGSNPKTPGNRMMERRDPAKSLKHGHQAGVRRDSAAEKKKN